jgi:uncharacterized iron-regulated membrane protein
MGSLSVFDKEIDCWMMPATRLPPAETVALDRAAETARRLAPASGQWRFFLPTERTPQLRLQYRDAKGESRFRDLHPATGEALPEAGTLAGTGFIFPFHFSLHLRWRSIGYWLVGLAGMAMLALLVSGVVIHRKLFREFFILRWQRRLPRATLDVHNATGVLGLPFHFVMTLSGLVIFFAIYFPMAVDAVYGDDRAAFNRDAYGSYHRPAAGEPGELASLDAMADKATSTWGEPPHYMRVWHPRDANAYVQLRRSRETGVSLNRDALVFDAATGALLHAHDTTGAMAVPRPAATVAKTTKAARVAAVTRNRTLHRPRAVSPADPRPS